MAGVETLANGKRHQGEGSQGRASSQQFFEHTDVVVKLSLADRRWRREARHVATIVCRGGDDTALEQARAGRGPHRLRDRGSSLCLLTLSVDRGLRLAVLRPSPQPLSKRPTAALCVPGFPRPLDVLKTLAAGRWAFHPVYNRMDLAGRQRGSIGLRWGSTSRSK